MSSRITESRNKNYEGLAARRQLGLTVILENVHDPHNVGAVLRSCDSAGIQEIYILYTQNNMKLKDFKIGKTTSSGAWKYIEVHLFDDREECFKVIKSKYNKIWATHLGEKSVGMYDIDMKESIALLFGNEHAGITPETLSYCDGNYVIPPGVRREELNNNNIEGIIVGKAIYDGDIKLEELIKELDA